MKLPFLSYLSSIAMVALATLVAYLARRISTGESLSLIFLTPVLLSAIRFGLWPSVLASVLGVLAWDFFFTLPIFSFQIADQRDILTLIFFLVVALIVSNLAALKLRQAEIIAERSRTTEQLYKFSQNIASAASLDELLAVVAHRIASMLTCDVTVLLPEASGLMPRSAYPPGTTLEVRDLAAARTALGGNRPTGHGTDTLPASRHRFLPLSTGAEAIGVISIDRGTSWPLHRDEERLLAALVHQAAVAIERIQLAETIEQARLQAETERIRSAMLTSVSHDLRTPLTTIIGTHSALRDLGESCTPEVRADLLERAQVEAERLNRLIGNLLDMTRLQSGRLNVRLEPIDIGDAIESAVERASPLIAAHEVKVSLAADLPMAEGDFLLIEQIVFNLIDNASKYAPTATAIEIAARVEGPSVVVEVADHGPGIPAHALETIFDQFARIEYEDRKRPGTGLGLAICRGFLAAMKGTIMASNRAEDGPGAVFTVRLTRSIVAASQPVFADRAG